MSPASTARAVRSGSRLAPAGPSRAPSRPRRISGPARPAARPASRPPAARAAVAGGGVALPLPLRPLGLLGAALGSLAGHRLFERLLKGRLWIGLVAFALIGIVTLQLGLLKLNSGIGRSLEREGSLQRQNAALAIENSELSSGDRVENEAKHLGMQLVSEEQLRFLSSHPAGDIAAAVRALSDGSVGQSGTSTDTSTTTTTATGAASTTEAGSEAGGSEQAAESSTSGEAAATGQPATETQAPTGEEATSGEASGEQAATEQETEAPATGTADGGAEAAR